MSAWAWQRLELDDDPADDDADDRLDGLAMILEAIEDNRPAWQADALCLEYPGVSFFPEKGESTAEAKAICGRCAVAQECAEYAIAENLRHGIWGGRAPRERR